MDICLILHQKTMNPPSSLPVLLLSAVLVAVLGAVERGPGETTDRSRWFET